MEVREITRTYASRHFYFNAVLLFFLVLPSLTDRPALSEPSRAPTKILAFGDSLTAGLGLQKYDDFAEQLSRSLKRDGYHVLVINAGVSGDTTAGGVARVDWVMRVNPDLVILELGANDGLRGLDPEATKNNLATIIRRIQAKGAVVLLAGMRAPPNLGVDYGAAFDNIFPDLANIHQLNFYPFFLDGVASKSELNLADGIHPNKSGIKVIVEGILPTVKRSLEKIR